MPPPKIFPCGGQGEPACPPMSTVTKEDIVEAYNALPENQQPKLTVASQAKGWVKSQSGWAHATAAAIVSIGALVDTDGAFRDGLLKLFAHHPKLGSQLVLLATLITMYVKSQKKEH